MILEYSGVEHWSWVRLNAEVAFLHRKSDHRETRNQKSPLFQGTIEKPKAQLVSVDAAYVRRLIRKEESQCGFPKDSRIFTPWSDGEGSGFRSCKLLISDLGLLLNVQAGFVKSSSGVR